jgi:hypothetical protein
MRRRIGGGVLVVLVLLMGWLAFRGYQLRRELLAARSSLSGVTGQLTADDSSDLDRRLRQAASHADNARSASNDPLWRLAATVPLVGASFDVGSGAADAVHDLLRRVVPPAREAVDMARSAPLFQNGTVDLRRIDAMAPSVDRAFTAAEATQDRVDALPRKRLPGPVARQRDDLQRQVDRLASALRSADAAVRLAPGMLGANGPRRYFLAVQGNAEARGTGGLVGAYALIRTERGRISRERVGNNLDLLEAPRPVVDLGPDFAAMYDSDSARAVWYSAVLTPHWPSASRIMAGLWKAQGGGPVDGVLGVDPLSIAPMLRATGPVQLNDITVTGDNVVDFVLRDQYAMFPRLAVRDARKQLMAQLASAVYDGVIEGHASSVSLVRALGEAGASGHLQIWSAHASEQRVLQALRVGGALPATAGAFLEVISNNAAGNKADYYVRRKVSYQRPRRGVARVTITLSNLMKPAGLPYIVVGRFDKPKTAPEPGATRQIVTLFVGVGKRVLNVSVDGQPAATFNGREQGHGVASTPVEIRPSRPTVIVAEIEDPGGELDYRQQPLVVPDELALAVPHHVT